MTRTAQELKNRIEAAMAKGFKSISVTMKCNGDEVIITPCMEHYGSTKFEDIGFFLLDSPSTYLCGSESIEKVAETLRKYADILEEDKQCVRSLKEHIRKHGKDSDWDFVSDYHKDIFGHRPHVGVDRLIAWANSDSLNSARAAF